MTGFFFARVVGKRLSRAPYICAGLECGLGPHRFLRDGFPDAEPCLPSIRLVGSVRRFAGREIGKGPCEMSVFFTLRIEWVY